MRLKTHKKIIIITIERKCMWVCVQFITGRQTSFLPVSNFANYSFTNHPQASISMISQFHSVSCDYHFSPLQTYDISNYPFQPPLSPHCIRIRNVEQTIQWYGPIIQVLHLHEALQRSPPIKDLNHLIKFHSNKS